MSEGVDGVGVATSATTYYIVHMFTNLRQSLLSAAVQRHLALALVLVLITLPDGSRAQDMRLLMIEQAGCYYCRVFNRDMAPIYEKSEEGMTAPLVHAQLREPLPEGITLASTPFVTPTFVLLGPDGHEIERLTGFPGEDFFWSYIGDMISTASEALNVHPED